CIHLLHHARDIRGTCGSTQDASAGRLRLSGATTGYAAGLAVDDAAKDVVYDYDAWNVLVELDNGEVLRIGSRKYYGSHFEAGQRIEIYSPIAADGSALFRPAK
ncbi:hypothetical protein ACFOW3_12850, partial [Acidovorax facilis]